jgi:GH15 family glucan-1,4-alpha-glucosidase
MAGLRARRKDRVTSMISSADRWTEGAGLKPATAIVGFVIPGNLPVEAAPNLEGRWVLLRVRDYRYSWLRDATVTLLSFIHLGYFDEARAWRDWLFRVVAGSPNQMQIMYGVGGERRLPELTLPWLPGYENSSPVRIGNAAQQQFQLDVYGELADAMFQARKGGIEASDRGRALRPVILKYLTEAWRQPDDGIWEVRGGRQHFVHSKVMAWVAFDRTAKQLEEEGLKDEARHCQQTAAQIHAEVCERGFDRDLYSFVQAYGSKRLDASLLQLPLVGFLPASDPRIKGTLRAIEQRLLINREFVLRYESNEGSDGLPEGEGAFLACSFWLVDNYVLQRRDSEARNLFERLLTRCNDVGLLAEEFDPKAGRMLGNFPQAYSHVGLINSALNLRLQVRPVERRAAA